MTDGQADVDLDKIRNKRKAIDRKTPIDLMFVAINQTNPKLMELAHDHAKGGFKGGHYREFMPEDITKALEEAKAIKIPKKEDAFFTQKTAQDIPEDVFNQIDVAARLARQYASHLLNEAGIRDPKEWANYLETIKQPDAVEIERPLSAWFIALRGFFVNNTRNRPILKDKNLAHAVVDDILRHFDRLTGVRFEAVSHEEMENIRHLLSEVR
jgi:hypothetical protein